METNVEEERRRFVRAYTRGDWTMSALCAQFGISRPTGYKWWARSAGDAEADFRDQPRTPHHSPTRTAPRVEALIVEARREYGWGAKKLRHVLQTKHPQLDWPARSTVNDILDRHGLLQKQRRRSTWPHSGTVTLQTERPNQVWPADFKGQFKTGDGRYCYPLTITDHFSRRVLVVTGLPTITSAGTRAIFLRLFRQVGLPDAIRTDNGQPFASPALHGLSALNVWWMQLGIVHQRIRPARPQENATHERMHRELKRETTQPAAATGRAQQRRFDAFRQRYNEVRPHEGIANEIPNARWEPSHRSYPEQIAPPAYPSGYETRRVSSAGTIRFQGHVVFVSQALHHQDLGLTAVDDGLWRIVYYQTAIGTLDERTHRVTGLGRIATV